MDLKKAMLENLLISVCGRKGKNTKNIQTNISAMQITYLHTNVVLNFAY